MRSAACIFAESTVHLVCCTTEMHFCRETFSVEVLQSQEHHQTAFEKQGLGGLFLVRPVQVRRIYEKHVKVYNAAFTLALATRIQVTTSSEIAM